MASIMNSVVQLDFFTDAEREVIKVLPTGEELLKAGVPNEIMYEQVSMDLATWTQGVYKYKGEYFRPMDENFQSENRPTESVNTNWSLESIWEYMMDSDLVCNKMSGPYDNLQFAYITNSVSSLREASSSLDAAFWWWSSTILL